MHWNNFLMHLIVRCYYFLTATFTRLKCANTFIDQVREMKLKRKYMIWIKLLCLIIRSSFFFFSHCTEDRPDGSGSECNSVVPKKRRRRNGAGDSDSYLHLSDWASPRSSRSSASSRSSKSSRSSSLIQFETLERTCATVSPSGYSYDSLEYSSNRSNSHFENTSPDSLEGEEEDADDDDDTDDDDDRTLTNVKKPSFDLNHDSEFPKIRPYRSFDSLPTNQKSSDTFDHDTGHGFMFAKTTSNDLSERGRRGSTVKRWAWHWDSLFVTSK